MDALIRGNDFAPFPSTGVRERLEQQPIEEVYAQLQQVDPEAAGRLHLADKKRIIRAMEVYLETGQTITAHNLKTQAIPPRYDPVWFGLEDENRADLYDRIDRRVEIMVEQGLLDEIKNLLDRGIPERCTAMQAIGYKEFLQVFHGNTDVNDAISQVQQASRKYAKRQLTWFRRNTAMNWLRRAPGDTTEEILMQARRILLKSDN